MKDKFAKSHIRDYLYTFYSLLDKRISLASIIYFIKEEQLVQLLILRGLIICPRHSAICLWCKDARSVEDLFTQTKWYLCVIHSFHYRWRNDHKSSLVKSSKISIRRMNTNIVQISREKPIFTYYIRSCADLLAVSAALVSNPQL